MTTSDRKVSDAIGVIAIITIAILGLAWLYSSMPKVSFDGMAAYQAEIDNAEQLACSDLFTDDIPGAGYRIGVRRCTFPDGLECVYFMGDGGVSCNWDAVVSESSNSN